MRRVRTGGGWPAVAYTFRKAHEAGSFLKLWKAMRSKNACKTCALGMGGQRGGMVNESGHFPEVCKKSLQAMVADMQGAIGPEFWQQYSPVALQSFTPRELEHCGRLTQPVLYTPDLRRYQPISWDSAFQRISSKLRELSADETFWYFSGRSSNEAGFLLQLFARLYGTNNVNNCSYYCHQASGVGLSSVTGSGTATITLEDLDKADLVFVIGGNPASNHPRLMRTLMQVRRRGGDVIVINPLVETGLVNFSVPSDIRSLLFGSEIASLYVQPHIGGDLALLTGIAKRIVETAAHDSHFLQSYCDGWWTLKAQLQSTSWAEIVDKSGVPQQQINAIAERYARSKSAVFSWTMGITHHVHGVKNVQAIGNLALLRGMVGRPGAGLMPIRGHSNVQGMGSVGVTPQLKQAIFDRLQKHFDVQLPTTQGRDTMACLEGASQGLLKLGFCLGGNLYGSNPDAQFAQQALENLDMLVTLSTTLNTGHAFGLARETILLPVLARDEEPQPTTQESMFNFVRLSDGGPPRLAGPKSEVEIIATLADQVLNTTDARADFSQVHQGPVGGVSTASASTHTASTQVTAPTGTPPTSTSIGSTSNGTESSSEDSSRNGSVINWRSMQDTGRIRAAIAEVIPGFENIENMDQTKIEFQIDGRTFHEPKFKTGSGRAKLHTHQIPPLLGSGDNQLRLMTIRSEGQFNTVVYEEHDLYRGVERRDVILIHPDDIKRLGLDCSMTVKVCGPAGSLSHVRLHAFPEIRRGNAAMYFPEANVLVSRQLDADSKTPAFKNVIVTLEKETLAVV